CRRSHARRVSGVSPLSSAAALTGYMALTVQAKYSFSLYKGLTRHAETGAVTHQARISTMHASSPLRSGSRLAVLAAALALGLAAPLANAAGTGEAAAAKPARATADIVDTAVAAGQFKTLAAALQAAGLVGTLKGEGSFTVFAPPDEAFAALPAGTVESLLKPENREKLTAILTYHVVPGRHAAADVSGMATATTVNGEAVDIRSAGSGVMVDGARVVKADIAASNGVIHVIDKVLMP